MAKVAQKKSHSKGTPEDAPPLSEAVAPVGETETPLVEASSAPRKPEIPPPSARKLEDRAIVRRAVSGDQSAFFELSKKYRGGIERLIRPMVRSASTAEVEDLVQESLTKAFLHITSYSEEYAFSTWLYRIATNHAIDYLRRRKLNAFSISQPAPGMNRGGEDEGRDFELRDDSWVPDEVMLAEERTRLIEEAIENLPDNYRRIIRLRHNDDLEYEQISQKLQIPMGTVKVHLHRARAALAKALAGKI